MEALIAILSELHPEIDFEVQENLLDQNLLDSFDIVSIVAEICLVFGIAVPPEEIVPHNFHSARAMAAMIERLRSMPWS